MALPDRYHRQRLLSVIGDAGQARLREARVLVAGCGALGSVAIEILAGAGVGTLVLVDRDVVEWTNLQRQPLYEERHAREGTPKAAAAAERVAATNSEVRTVVAVEDLAPGTVRRLAAGCDLIVDGLDNFETRYLLNDLAVSEGLPYLYAGAVATTAMLLVVLPSARRRRAAAPRRVAWPAEKAGPCLRCIFPEPPPPGTAETCDTAGVLAGAVTAISALQATQAIKLLVGDLDAVERRLVSVDLWSNDWRFLDVSAAGPGTDPSGAPAEPCPCCGEGRFDFLDGDAAGAGGALCGRDAVQVIPSGAGPGRLDLGAAAAKLAPHGTFIRTAHLLRGTLAGERGELGPIELTLFADGRAVVKGTREPERARAVYARYVGT